MRWNPFLRWPRAALGITLLWVLPLGILGLHFRITPDTRDLLTGDQRNTAAYAQLRQLLGDTDVLVVGVQSPDLFTPAGLDQVRRLSDALRALPEVREVQSLTHSYRPVRTGLRFAFVPLVTAETFASPDRLRELRAFCLSHPLVRNVLVSADGTQTLVLVYYRAGAVGWRHPAECRAMVEGVLAPFRAEGLAARSLALPLIEGELRASLRRDVGWFVPAAASLMLVILGRLFRSLRLVVVVGLNLALVAGVLAGLAVVTEVRLTVFAAMLPPLLGAIQLSLLAHLLTAFQAAAPRSATPSAALAAALRVVHRPALFASLTTLVGLLALAAAGEGATRQFGMLGAAGLILVHLLTFGPGLTWVALVHPTLPRPRTDPPGGNATRDRRELDSVPARDVGDQALAWADRWMTRLQRHGRWILLAYGAVVLAGALGWARVRTDLRPVEFLRRDSATRKTIEAWNEAFGGINVVPIELDSGRADGIHDPRFLRFLDEVQRHAEAITGLTGAYSYAQLLALANEIWEGGQPGTRHLPDQAWRISLFAAALRSFDFPLSAALTDAEFRTASLILRTTDLSAKRYLALIDEVVSHAERIRPAGVQVSATRGVATLLEADRRLMRRQGVSVALTLLGIAGLLGGLWRSAPMVLWALLGNLVPVALVGIALGWGGGTLNSVTVLVAAVALGMAVDNTIHLLTHWHEERRRGQSPTAAMVRSLAVKARPMTGAALVLIALFGVFGLASFPPVVQFGLWSALAFAGSLASGWVVVPLLAGRTICRPDRRPDGSEKPEEQNAPPNDP